MKTVKQSDSEYPHLVIWMIQRWNMSTVGIFRYWERRHSDQVHYEMMIWWVRWIDGLWALRTYGVLRQPDTWEPGAKVQIDMMKRESWLLALMDEMDTSVRSYSTVGQQWVAMTPWLMSIRGWWNNDDELAPTSHVPCTSTTDVQLWTYIDVYKMEYLSWHCEYCCIALLAANIDTVGSRYIGTDLVELPPSYLYY